MSSPPGSDAPPREGDSVPAKFISGDPNSGKRSSLTSIFSGSRRLDVTSTTGSHTFGGLLCRGTIHMRHEKRDSNHNKTGFVNKLSRPTRKVLILSRSASFGRSIARDSLGYCLNATVK